MYDNKLYLSILLAEYHIALSKIEKNLNFDYDLITTFCDAHNVEHYIAQRYKNSGVKTITLQHGQYKVIKNEYIIGDNEAYNNFISDYILLWGEKTKDEFLKAGISEDRLIVVGALKNKFYSKFTDLLSNHFCVSLDGEAYEQSNFAMINIANQISDKIAANYTIRFHPKNNKTKYIKATNKYYVDQNYNFAYFQIIHMSSVIFEYLTKNIPIYVFYDEQSEEIFNIEDVIFNDLESFLKVNKNYHDKKIIISNIKTRFIEDNPYNNYKRFIEKMLRS